MLSFVANERIRWCAFVAAVACVILLPGLGAFGFWDPYELDALEGAWSAAFGARELAARLPRALAGIALVLIAFAWASRLGGTRVGAITGLLVAASPLVVAASRQVGTPAGGLELACGHVLLLGGASIAVFPRGAGSRVLGALGIAAGGALSYQSGGALLGLAAPALALAAAAAGAGRWRLASGSAAVAIAAAAAAIFGVAPAGPAWASPPREIAWSVALERVAYGMFPWAAIVPVALGAAAVASSPRKAAACEGAPAPWSPAAVRDLERARGRTAAAGGGIERAFAARLAAAWIGASLVACTYVSLAVSPAPFPAVAGAALAAALWLDDLAAARARGAPGAVVLAGLFALVLARDLAVFPDRLAALPFGVPVEGVIAGAGLRAIPIAVALAFVFAIAASGYASRPRIVRSAVWGAVSACAAGAVLHAAVWTPAVARHLSARHLFGLYGELAKTGEPLAVQSMNERVVKLYADEARRAERGADVVEHLEARTRTFAILPRRALCPVTQTLRARDRALHVLGDSEVFALVSNRREEGEPRGDGLGGAISGRAPSPDRRIGAVLADGIEILGIDMPARVSRGERFEVTLYYRVIRRPKRRWRVFVHFDGSTRFQGDHEPIGGRCSPLRWNPGDYIVDRFPVRAGTGVQPPGRYRVWVGFFVGSSPNWTNMEVVSGDADPEDRVLAGTLEVR